MTVAIEQQLTARQAAILGCYTGFSFGPFADIQQLAEELLRRPIWTHQFADPALVEELKKAVKPLMLEISISP